MDQDDPESIARRFKSFPHPYEYEIGNIEYPSWLFAPKQPVQYDSLDIVPVTWVETLEQLQDLEKKLKASQEFAVYIVEPHPTK